MVIFGLFLQLVQNQPSFLLAFGIGHSSFFMSLCLFIGLYLVSLDVPLRMGINWQSRRFEL